MLLTSAACMKTCRDTLKHFVCTGLHISRSAQLFVQRCDYLQWPNTHMQAEAVKLSRNLQYKYPTAHVDTWDKSNSDKSSSAKHVTREQYQRLTHDIGWIPALCSWIAWCVVHVFNTAMKTNACTRLPQSHREASAFGLKSSASQKVNKFLYTPSWIKTTELSGGHN